MTGQFLTYRSFSRDRMARVWHEGSASAPKTLLLNGSLAHLFEVSSPMTHAPLVGERVLLPLVDHWDLLSYVQSDDCVRWDDLDPRDHCRWDSPEHFHADLLRQLEVSLDYGAPVLQTVTPEMAVQRGWATPNEELPVATRPVEARDGELLPSYGDSDG